MGRAQISGNVVTIGNLTVTPSGLSFGTGGASFGSLSVNGWGIDDTGNIIGAVQDGSSAYFYSIAVTDDISLGGNLTVGPSMVLGSWYNGSATWNGTLIKFHDNGDHVSSTTTFLANSTKANWLWETFNFDDYDVVSQMVLDENGNLSLGDTNATPLLIASGNFTVAGHAASNFTYTSPFSSAGNLSLNGGNIVLNATNSTIPSLTLGWVKFSTTNGVVTVGDSNTTSNFTFDPGNLTLSFSSGVSLVGSASSQLIELNGIGMTIGANSSVSGAGALTLGDYSHASGVGALAFGGGNSTGNFAIALGNNSIANGTGAIAIGGANATANGALAIGINSTATGTGSTAMGSNLTVQTWNTLVLGSYNQVVSGNATAWQSADPAFILGLGNSTSSFNGLVMHNSGNHTLNGNLTINSPDYISPTSSEQPGILQVQGSTQFNGAATLNGETIMSQRQGDILMGQFVN